jgi:hypothetical protein
MLEDVRGHEHEKVPFDRRPVGIRPD